MDLQQSRPWIWNNGWQRWLFCGFLCLYKRGLNRVDSGHNEFGTIDLAGINFDDGAGNDDDALDVTPRKKKWRGG